jgi:hypothetical protein
MGRQAADQGVPQLSDSPAIATDVVDNAALGGEGMDGLLLTNSAALRGTSP